MNARWHTAKTDKPPLNLHGESEYLLCMEENSDVPFVGWYSATHHEWYVAHWKADSLPVRVTKWREMIKLPRGAST